MKKKEILEKYQIKRGTFDRLRYDGKIVKQGFYDFSIDEEFMKTFNEEQYTKEWKERPEQKARIAERNKKVNEARWSNITEEGRQAFKEKVSKGVRKAQSENPDCIERMRKGLKVYWSKSENTEAHRQRMLQVYSDPKKRENISKGCKKHWSNEDVREAKRQQMLKYWSEHPEKIEQMKETNRRVQKALWTPEKRLKQSETIKQLWRDNGHEMALKRANTMKRNGTVNYSGSAKYCIELLESLGLTIKTEQPYPFKELCKFPYDAYIVELDTYIEFNFGFFHGKEPYEGLEEQMKHVDWLKAKEKEYFESENHKNKSKYGDKVQKWTVNDVTKRKFFEQHPEYSWFEFFTVQEFETWLSILLEQSR